ncbi:class I SAM-dependent methyltransferase [Pelagicoccus enzymogenes]|uniref:class I SAM-dependent methyltransferase n=1 Tax=Pelagicoccus enzymogenes TaxID=2773457 RepID=UPI00280FE183|nr:class I SAM-dependent methyltransferase [Pelagicoccus enzymogenes]MDQ8199114.1 class I SAM-dependent methyltransferase [Pelagicoccus enzymogenes]
MDPNLLHSFSKTEKDHWWFYGRRKIVERVLKTATKQLERPDILEIGCGTGGNLEMLSRYGRLRAIEMDTIARQTAVRLKVCEVEYGKLPDQIKVQDDSVDIALMLDVLEHVENDTAALDRVKRLLRPGGHAIITVPALPSMWSAHDDANHHFRRYTKDSLTQLAIANDLIVEQASYFNTTLFPLAYIERKIVWRKKREYTPPSTPPFPLNALLRTVFALESLWVLTVKPPLGLSLLLSVRKRQSR